MNEDILSKVIGYTTVILYALLSSSAASKTLTRKGRSGTWRWICLFFPPAYIFLFLLGSRFRSKKFRPITGECPACVGIVSSDAKSCPHCGHPLKKRKNPYRISIIEVSWIITTMAMTGFLIWYNISVDQETGFPKCESDYAKSMLLEAIDKAPLGRVNGVSILAIKDVKLVRVSSAEKVCVGTAILNTSAERPLTYRFYRDYGTIFIEAHFSD